MPFDAGLGEERVREGVADRQGAAGGVADIGLLRLAAREYVGDEIVVGAPERWLHEGPREASSEAVGIDAGELALGCVEVIAKIVEVAVDPEGLASAEQVAVGIVGADAGSVDGGVGAARLAAILAGESPVSRGVQSLL